MIDKRNRNVSMDVRSTILYALRGTILCRAAFASIVHIDEQTIQRHGNRVANGSEQIVYQNKAGLKKQGVYGVQRMIVKGFLLWYSSVNGL